MPLIIVAGSFMADFGGQRKKNGDCQSAVTSLYLPLMETKCAKSSCAIVHPSRANPLPVSPANGRAAPRAMAAAAAGSNVTEPGGRDGNRQLLEALRRSSLYLDYERAFNDATGLPLIVFP